MKRFRTALLAAASIAATLACTSPGSAQTEQPPKPGGTLRIGLIQLEKRVLADLHVNEGGLHVVTGHAKGFLVSPLLGVIAHRLSDVGHVDAEMVHHHHAAISALREG